jgi:hypothetical protein
MQSWLDVVPSCRREGPPTLASFRGTTIQMPSRAWSESFLRRASGTRRQAYKDEQCFSSNAARTSGRSAPMGPCVPWLKLSGRNSTSSRGCRLIDQDRKEVTINPTRYHSTQVRQVWGCFWVEPEPHGFRQLPGDLGVLRMRFAIVGAPWLNPRPAPSSQSR